MKFYTERFLQEKREQWKDAFRKVQANVSGTWYDGEIQSKEIEGNNININVVFGVLDERTCDISEVRFLDKNGYVVGSEIVNVHKINTQSTLFVYKFPIFEVEN